MSVKFVVCVFVYLFIILAVVFLSYEQGFYDGARALCVSGVLVEDDNIISCVLPFNNSDSFVVSSDFGVVL